VQGASIFRVSGEEGQGRENVLSAKVMNGVKKEVKFEPVIGPEDVVFIVNEYVVPLKVRVEVVLF